MDREVEVLSLRMLMHLRLRPWAGSLSELAGKPDGKDFLEDILPCLEDLLTAWQRENMGSPDRQRE